MRALTKKQQSVLSFLEEARAGDGPCPSYRDIGKRLKIRSTNGVKRHVDALVRKGFLDHPPGKARALQLKRGKLAVPRLVSMLGTVPAGIPDGSDVRSGEESVSLQIDPSLLDAASNAHLFAVRVRGDSMMGVAILDGDLAVLEDRPPKANDIVSALIDREPTLKRLVFKGRRAFLKAENPQFPEMRPLEELTVQGVLIALFRRFGSRFDAAPLP